MGIETNVKLPIPNKLFIGFYRVVSVRGKLFANRFGFGYIARMLQNPRHEEFARHVANGEKVSHAYAKAFNHDTRQISDAVMVGGSKLVRQTKVANRIKELKDAAAQKAEYSIADMLRDQLTIARTDRRELFDVTFGACRYCYGENHQFHWKEREYLEACRAAEARQEPLPDPAGGFGYMRTEKPNPDCPDCEGVGVEIVRLKDTRDLSPAAVMIYDGVKETRQGIEVKTKDAMKAWDNVGKILGAFLTRQEMSGPGGKPIKMDMSSLTEEQLKALASIAVDP